MVLIIWVSPLSVKLKRRNAAKNDAALAQKEQSIQTVVVLYNYKWNNICRIEEEITAAFNFVWMVYRWSRFFCEKWNSKRCFWYIEKTVGMVVAVL